MKKKKKKKKCRSISLQNNKVVVYSHYIQKDKHRVKY